MGEEALKRLRVKTEPGIPSVPIFHVFNRLMLPNFNVTFPKCTALQLYSVCAAEQKTCLHSTHCADKFAGSLIFMCNVYMFINLLAHSSG